MWSPRAQPRAEFREETEVLAAGSFSGYFNSFKKCKPICLCFLVSAEDGGGKDLYGLCSVVFVDVG